MQRWTTNALNQLKADLLRFFGAYYSELLRLVEEQGSDDLPDWLRGRRLIHVYVCADGVIVAHIHLDKIPSQAKLEKDRDGNLFWFQYDPASLVKDRIRVFEPAPRLGGSAWPQWHPPDYVSGQIFGRHVVGTPLQIYVQMGEQDYTKEEWPVWSRLEWSDMKHIIDYRDASLAKREAQNLVKNMK